MSQGHVIERNETTVSIFSDFITQVYFWMAGGLLITFGIAMVLGNAIANDSDLYNSVAGILPLLFLLELGLVIAISAGAQKFSVGVSALLFALYSISNGVFFGVIFTLYTAESVAATFGATFLTFAVMSVYGYVSKQDLTKWGNIALMALFGLIIGSIVNIFLVDETLYWILTYLGIVIFIVLIAYDTQKLKNIAAEADARGIAVSRLAVRGALTLYLDFINLFIRLLSIFGKRK